MSSKSVVKRVKEQNGPSGGWMAAAAVGSFAPYTPARIVRAFDATVADELSVRRGSAVAALYRDGEWLFVVDDSQREGFVPADYCELLVDSYSSSEQKQRRGGKLYKMVRGAIGKSTRNSSHSSSIESFPQTSHKQIDEPAVVTRQDADEPSCIDKVDQIEDFVLTPAGYCEVVHSFDARCFDDLTVRSGDVVQLLNVEDPDWTYVRRPADMSLGFVPRAYISPCHSCSDV